VSEADTVLAELGTIMDRLAQTIAEETGYARAGRLTAATQVSERKAELARLYSAESQRVKAGLGDVSPGIIAELRTRHTAFHSLLQTNLTVLATAHAVSDGIIRGVSDELSRKQAPATYGASGRANAPTAKTSQPLALSRTL
jgi:hypothetical protein